MITEITTGLGSLKAAFDIAKGLNAVENATAINDVKLTLQSHILDAQQSLFAAQETQVAASARITDLEAQIMRMQDWSSEREHYELVSIGEGGFAFMLKPAMRGLQPPHWLCTHCFDAGKKSILQKQKSDGNQAFYACPACKSTLATHWMRVPEYMFTAQT